MTNTFAGTINAQRQNAELTFKDNLHRGRHGWLRLTPAYSVHLVEEILGGRNGAATVLDPFSGTGTTALSAAYLGLKGLGLEINPFLVWFSSVKFQHFSPSVLERIRHIGETVADASLSSAAPHVEPPPLHNIRRWWNEPELRFLCRLKNCILNSSEPDTAERDLLLVAFCRALIALSNAAFNHQSMSFKPIVPTAELLTIRSDMADKFRRELEFVLKGAADNPFTRPSVVTGDARNVSRYIREKCDILITSPPYPNRISYIRELRPYMYWLGFLSNGREAGEHDWQAIGGTWGLATSRLAEWEPSGDSFTPSVLQRSLQEISSPKNRNGRLLANYVAKYFEDMWRHFTDIVRVLNDGAEAHYIVGNSIFYGIQIPVEEIFRAMMEEVGFHSVRALKIRKRNSKAGLYEYDVTGFKGVPGIRYKMRKSNQVLQQQYLCL